MLALLADGWGLREIASCMGLSERQARRCRDRAREACGASTTYQAVAIYVARRAG